MKSQDDYMIEKDSKEVIRQENKKSHSRKHPSQSKMIK